MLKVDDLQNQIQSALETYIPAAIEQCKLSEYPTESKIGRKKAKEFADTFKDLVCEPLANAIAGAIDYYVKNASITGTIITVGSPVMQMANVISMPTPVVNGKIINTLGIS